MTSFSLLFQKSPVQTQLAARYPLLQNDPVTQVHLTTNSVCVRETAFNSLAHHTKVNRSRNSTKVWKSLFKLFKSNAYL